MHNYLTTLTISKKSSASDRISPHHFFEKSKTFTQKRCWQNYGGIQLSHIFVHDIVDIDALFYITTRLRSGLGAFLYISEDVEKFLKSFSYRNENDEISIQRILTNAQVFK